MSIKSYQGTPPQQLTWDARGNSRLLSGKWIRRAGVYLLWKEQVVFPSGTNHVADGHSFAENV